MDPFNEEKLREDIIKTWGPAGAHIEVFDMMRVCTECRGGCPDKEHPVARRMCQECYDNIVRLPFDRLRADLTAALAQLAEKEGQLCTYLYIRLENQPQ